jgi:hypothetical protein
MFCSLNNGLTRAVIETVSFKIHLYMQNVQTGGKNISQSWLLRCREIWGKKTPQLAGEKI